MVQSADPGYSNDCTKLLWLDVPRDRCISLQGDMRPGLVVVADVFAEDLSEVIFAEEDRVVQACDRSRKRARKADREFYLTPAGV